MTHPKKETVLLLSHRTDEGTLRLHRRLTETSGGRPVVFLYHGHPDGETLPRPFHSFPAEDLLRPGYRTIESPCLMMGHTNFPVLDFAARHPAPERFWVIEYDVRFTGEWRVLFDHFRDSTSDLLTCCIGDYDEDPAWPWWDLSHPRHYIPNKTRLRSFNPIYRISRRGVECLRTELASGWAGHQEVVMPTLLHRNGLELEDMGGDGPFVRGPKNRFYTSGPGKNVPFRKPADRSGAFKSGTMRYRPMRSRPGLRRHRLYHPIKPPEDRKSSGALKRLKTVCIRPIRSVLKVLAGFEALRR